MVRFLRLRIGGAEDAEELAQETFLRVWRTLERFDTARSFRAWLYTIAARLSVSYLRRPALTGAEGDDLARLPGAEPAPDERLMEEERGENLWNLARRLLTPEQLSALWLHYVEGLSTAQVAGVLAKPESSTRVTMHRARERLRARLGASPASEVSYVP